MGDSSYNVIRVRKVSDAKRYIQTKKCTCGDPYMIISVDSTKIDGKTCDLYHVVCRGCGDKKDLVFKLSRDEREPPEAY